jgi:hypothetical protein
MCFSLRHWQQSAEGKAEAARRRTTPSSHQTTSTQVAEILAGQRHIVDAEERPVAGETI